MSIKNKSINTKTFLTHVCDITRSTSAWCRECDGLEDVKSCTYFCNFRCATLIVWLGGMPWPKTGATQYHAQLGLPHEGHAIKGLIVFYDQDLEALNLLNGLALGCYQPSHDVWKILSNYYIFNLYVL